MSTADNLILLNNGTFYIFCIIESAIFIIFKQLPMTDIPEIVILRVNGENIETC